MTQLDGRIHQEFLWIYRIAPEEFKFLNIFSKNLRGSCEICSIFEIFLRKIGFFDKKNVDIFEK